MLGQTNETDALLREIRDGVRLIVAALANPLRKRLDEEFLDLDPTKENVPGVRRRTAVRRYR